MLSANVYKIYVSIRTGVKSDNYEIHFTDTYGTNVSFVDDITIHQRVFVVNRSLDCACLRRQESGGKELDPRLRGDDRESLDPRWSLPRTLRGGDDKGGSRSE